MTHDDLPDATLTLQDLIELHPPAKPCHNYVCAYPLPDPPKPDDQEDPQQFVQFGPMLIPVAHAGMQSNLRNGIVIEIGPLVGDLLDPKNAQVIQYQPGDTIYYGPGSAFNLDGYDYLQVGQYVSWRPNPDRIIAAIAQPEISAAGRERAIAIALKAFHARQVSESHIIDTVDAILAIR